MRTVATSLTTAILIALAAPASADTSTAAAEAAFQRAAKLRAENNWAEACEAFKQSNDLDPQFGTAFNLAGCYLQIKKLVLAWTTYSELAQKDTNAGRRGRSAQFAKDLAPRLSWIKLEGPAQRPDGFAVTIDGEPMTRLVGVEAPFDIGAHSVSAIATNMEPFTQTATIDKEGQHIVVTIPPLVPTKPAAPVEDPPKHVAVVVPEVAVVEHASSEPMTSPWVIALFATAGMYSAPPGVDTAPAIAVGPGVVFGRRVAGSSFAIVAAASADIVVDQSTFERVFAGAGVRFDADKIAVQLTPGLSVLTGAGDTVMGFGVDAAGTWMLTRNLGIAINVNASSVAQPAGFMGNLTVIRLGAGVGYRL